MNLRRVAMCFVVLALLAPVAGRAALAQEDDDLGVIYGFQAEALFPAVIRFYVAVSVPVERIAEVSLTLRAESGWERTIPVEPAANLLSGTDRASELAYPWSLAGEDAPPLFEPVVYAWRVVTADGQTSTAEDEFLVVDAARGEWRSAGEAPLVLHWHNEDLGGGLIQGRCWRRWICCGGTRPVATGRLRDLRSGRSVVPGDGRSGNRRPDPGGGLAARCRGVPLLARGVRGLQPGRDRVRAAPSYGYTDLRDLLIRRMVSGTYRSLWSGAVVPDWFVTGLALLYQQRPGSAALALARSAARVEALAPLAELQTSPRKMPLPAAGVVGSRELSAGAVSGGSFRRGGAVRAGRAIGPQDFAAALRAQTTLDEVGLWNAFNRWLFLEAADRAVLWTPYLYDAHADGHGHAHHSAAHGDGDLDTDYHAHGDVDLSRRAGPDRRRDDAAPTPDHRATTPLPPGSLPTATRPAPAAQPVSEDREGIDPAVAGGIAAAVVAALGLALLAWGRRRRR